MIMGILSSMLSGAAYGTELGDMVNGPRPGADGHFLMALKVGAFQDLETFKTRVDAAIEQVHDSRRAPGVDRLYVPGELEFENRDRYARAGIPLNAVTLRDLARTADSLGVATEPYKWL